jgi:molybdopterin converting factor small subunit
VTVHIPSPLRSYTSGKSEVIASGRTVGEIMLDLDRRYPGIRFRMIDEQDDVRPHMRIFVNREQIDDLNVAISEGDEVTILQALSGG